VLGCRRSRRQERSATSDDVEPIPSSALTRWLRQGIELHKCPLCRVAHKADREYMSQFSEEAVTLTPSTPATSSIAAARASTSG
jgi:hypothetical protein